MFLKSLIMSKKIGVVPEISGREKSVGCPRCENRVSKYHPMEIKRLALLPR